MPENLHSKLTTNYVPKYTFLKTKKEINNVTIKTTLID